jgi:hypothetical protein
MPLAALALPNSMPAARASGAVPGTPELNSRFDRRGRPLPTVAN